MVDIGDADGFAHAVERIINAPELAKQLAERGYQTLVSQFSKEAITDAYLKLFASRR